MTEKKQRVIQEDFALEPCKIEGYESFMEGLMNIVSKGDISEEMGEQIKSYTLAYLKKHPLDEFNRFKDNNYVREYIGRDSSGWEAIVMSWKKGNVTAIHTHPQFAGYNFADGVFLVEIFEEYKDGLKLAAKLTIDSQLGLFSIGEQGKFNNHIHRITCLSPTGHSLHIYSDDALKGAKLNGLKIYE